MLKEIKQPKILSELDRGDKESITLYLGKIGPCEKNVAPSFGLN